jgi:hypothetical protein
VSKLTFAILAACIGLMAIATSVPQAPANRGPVAEPEFDEPFATLASGTVGIRPWSTLVYRHRGRPCLDLSLATEGIALCEHPSPVAMPAISVSRGQDEVTVLAVLARAPVRRISLEFDQRKSKTLVLRPITSHIERLSHVSTSLRYGVKVFRGHFCLTHFVARNHARRSVFSGNQYSCEDPSP